MQTWGISLRPRLHRPRAKLPEESQILSHSLLSHFCLGLCKAIVEALLSHLSPSATDPMLPIPKVALGNVLQQTVRLRLPHGKSSCQDSRAVSLITEAAQAPGNKELECP